MATEITKADVKKIVKDLRTFNSSWAEGLCARMVEAGEDMTMYILYSIVRGEQKLNAAQYRLLFMRHAKPYLEHLKAEHADQVRQILS